MTDSIIRFAISIYTILLPIAWIALIVVIIVLLPLSFLKKTKSFAGTCIHAMSYLFGATTWILSCAITFSTWGWPALIIGIMFFGAGVVPIAILASFISLKNLSMGFSIIVMAIITFATRAYGFYMEDHN
ncbi:MAG: hypothetical protein HOK80_10690 [Candidatus Cloacimonetes bacterium]|jgi:hypothetical protein|nr:hypothetical protein [Candidatus Cloacimonadota bacterium]